MTAPAVEVRGLAKRFGQHQVLDGVDLLVAPGEVHGLLGPNGAGKSTVLGVLLGLVRPDAGSVRLLGRPVPRPRGVPPEGVAGFVAQPRFYPYLSGRANLGLVAAMDGRPGASRVEEALVGASLAGRAGEPVGGWSTGTRQRLGLAAALLRTPRLLVLDEPTTGLDPTGVGDLRAVVAALTASGASVLLTSHDMAEVAELCDAVTVLRAGRVAHRGRVADLRRRAPDPEHRLRTSDDVAALDAARTVPGVRARAQDAALVVQAGQAATDACVLALGRVGVAVREMTPRTSPLEQLFRELVEQEPTPEPDGAEPDGAEPDGAEPDGADPEPAVAVTPAPATAPGTAGRRVGAGVAYRQEVRKLAAQVRTRVLLGACALGPFVLAGALAVQSGVPADTLFGRWVHESGFALPLVVLSFASQWLLPALTSVVAGDIFSSEDHLGTWPLLLARGAGRGAVFAGKVAAALTSAVVAVLLLGAASLAAGVLAAGRGPLVDLSGVPRPAGAATGLVALAWGSALLPVVGFTALAVLASVLSRRSTVGIGVPVLAGLLLQLLSLASTPPAVRALLLTTGFEAWHGFAVSPHFTGPLVQAVAVDAGWTTVCLVLALVVFRRRDAAPR